MERDALGTVESVRVASLWDTLVKKLLVQHAPVEDTVVEDAAVEDALAEQKSVEHTRRKDKKTFGVSVGKGSKKASDFSLETRNRSEK